MPEHFRKISSVGTAGRLLAVIPAGLLLRLTVIWHVLTASAPIHTIIIHTIPFFEIASILFYEKGLKVSLIVFSKLNLLCWKTMWMYEAGGNVR
ncbi:hypothetical protein DXA96_00680 [Lachnospiraceae bacterium OF09-33XD]|nr:hypothetical protein DXA96_00680 [Lachnospiraceae bacterium OF09-33XD]